jgi:hypothetical protein
MNERTNNQSHVEMLNCRIAETEKLWNLEKRKNAALEQQLATANQARVCRPACLSVVRV